MSSSLTPKQRRAQCKILACFILALFGGVTWSFFFTWNDNIQLQGVGLGCCLIFLACGLTVWSHHLLPEGPFAEEYPALRSPAKSEAEVVARMDRGQVGRRKLLLAGAGAAGTSIAAGVLVNVRSFGPAPTLSIIETGWTGGAPMVTEDGSPVVAGSGIPVGSILTVFPKGFESSALSPAILVHLPPDANEPLPGRSGWAPDGYICYSKVCTHAGCPINLYDHAAMELMCPCHQSTFAAYHGALPVFGPAARPLPQLPLAIAADGTMHSTGNFSGPVGPTKWLSQDF